MIGAIHLKDDEIASLMCRRMPSAHVLPERVRAAANNSLHDWIRTCEQFRGANRTPHEGQEQGSHRTRQEVAMLGRII